MLQKMNIIMILQIMKTNYEFIEGRDYYFDKGAIVLTEYYLKKRGKCCGSGCRECPYWPRHTKGNTVFRDEEDNKKD